MSSSTGYEPNRAAVGTPDHVLALSGANAPTPTDQAMALVPGGSATTIARGDSAQSSIVPYESVPINVGEHGIVPYTGPGSVPVPDSPERAALRSQLQEMEQYMQTMRREMMQEAQDAMLRQRADFQRAASEYQQQARDVNAAEMATSRALMETEANSMLNQTEQILDLN